MDVLKELADTTSPEQVDSIYEKYNGKEESSSPDIAPGAAESQAPQQTWDGAQWSFDWSGKKVVPDSADKLKRWATQGYDYAQKMEAFKKQQAQITEQSKTYEKYKQIDDYVQKDPQWWQHVETEYKNRLASEDPVVHRVKGMLEEQLSPFKQLLAEKEAKETKAKIETEDKALDTEIKSIRDKYSNLDFDSPDADGKSLELKVLEHGATNRFPSFKAAFLDFYHEQLEKMWEARGREALTKGAQADAKAGIISKSNVPSQAKSKSFDVSGKSWTQIMNAARLEV